MKNKIPKSIALIVITSIFACNEPIQSDYSSCIDQFGNVTQEWNCNNNTPGFRFYYSSNPFYYGSHVYGGGYVSHSVNHVYIHKTINHTYTPYSPRINNSTSRSTVSKSIITLHARRK